MKKIVPVILAMSMLFLSACAPNEEELNLGLEKNYSNTIQSIASVDSLGRPVRTTGEYRQDKYVGLFYFTWNGQHDVWHKGLYDISKLINDDYEALLQIDSAKSANGQYHYWGEPLWGYYRGDEEWVIRKQVGMFTYAGIDFLGLDATNYYTPDLSPEVGIYKKSVDVLLKVLDEYYQDGWNVPKIMFLTNAEMGKMIPLLYETFYESGEYDHLWFKKDGEKPWIMGDPMQVQDPTIRNYFYYRANQWPNEPPKENGFPWMDFERPQRNYDGIVSVSVAQHVKFPFSDSAIYKDVTYNGIENYYYHQNWGRGFSSADADENFPDGKNSEERVLSGSNIQEQWDRAIELDPEIVFITGWNEWVALKLSNDYRFLGYNTELGLRAAWIDTYNMEFSRDIEPMKGGYGDNYYLQMIDNIRRFKGTEKQLVKPPHKTIDITGDASQWDEVDAVYNDFVGDAVVRDSFSVGNFLKYKDDSARNDIVEIRVAHDSDSLYFLIKSFNKLTERDQDDLSFMNLFLGLGTDSPKFDNYEFVVNRSASGSKASVERSKGGYSFEKVGEADYRLSGNTIQLKISKELLGISGDDFSLKFKVTDHIMHPEDIMDYYVSGDSAPIGRLYYVF